MPLYLLPRIVTGYAACNKKSLHSWHTFRAFVPQFHRQLAEFLLPWHTNAGHKAKETCLLQRGTGVGGERGRGESADRRLQMNSNGSNLERWNIAKIFIRKMSS